jgi:hypothetical protein
MRALHRFHAVSSEGFFMTTHFSSTMGRLGATVTGTIRVQLVAIPNFN